MRRKVNNASLDNILQLIFLLDQGGIFHIVFKANSGKVIDVITRVVTNRQAKCTRIVNSRIQSSPISVVTNGYQCGPEFFSDEILQESLDIARSSRGKNPFFPVSYTGSLYPQHSGYLIWPIYRDNNLYKFGQCMFCTLSLLY